MQTFAVQLCNEGTDLMNIQLLPVLDMARIAKCADAFQVSPVMGECLWRKTPFVFEV